MNSWPAMIPRRSTGRVYGSAIRSKRPFLIAIRHRIERSKDCLARNGKLYMVFKLGLCAESR